MRTEYCGLVDGRFIGQSVTLFGWVHRRRDHGGVIFIDLRDREGLVQVVCDPDRPAVFASAEKVRNEFCVKVVGQVRSRPAGTANASLVSGQVEVLCTELAILNPSVAVPFQLDDEDLSEATRLTHRVLDLRRAPMQNNLRLRYRVTMAVRRFFDAHGFIDVETSFLTEQEIRSVMEEMIRTVFREVLEVELPDPFPVMPYGEATARYGSDKPDLRVRLELTELTDAVRDVGFKVFSSAASLADGRVAALRVPRGGEMPRSEIDAMTEFVKIYGAKGLAYIKVNDRAKGRDGLQSPIVKNLHDAALDEILKRTGAEDGDVIFFGADRAKVVADSMGALRLKIGHSEFGRAHGLFEPGWQPLWVVDFPMFEYDEQENRYVAAHHPFTSPKDEHIEYLETDPSKCLAKAYDMALNGWEIGGGSVRIYREDVQSKVFRALKIGPEEARAKFGFLLDALQYGAPPHGGIAFGLDRIVTMMAGAESIRDVIAFPKTQRAQCLLTQAPSSVDERQLRELHIRVRGTQPAAEPKAA